MSKHARFQDVFSSVSSPYFSSNPTITTTMPPKPRKKTVKPVATTSNPIPLPIVTLGEEIHKDVDELAQSSPPPKPTNYTYPSPPQPNNTTLRELSPPKDDSEEDTDNKEEEEEEGEDGKKGLRMMWTEEMSEQLVEVLYKVFEDGGAADNSFKKATFEKTALKVRYVYKGSHKITWLKCKNKWADTKTKWGQWMFLSKQSGVGFNEEIELYKFSNYTWKSLNLAHPKII
jgi:hypothetical protein